MLAGVYQLTPLKRTCLQACRSAAAAITGYWASGASGAFRMGARHGTYCLGCCWALMLLLFVTGVMNLVAIAGITTLVLVEKLAAPGDRVATISGVALVGAAVWMLVV